MVENHEKITDNLSNLKNQIKLFKSLKNEKKFINDFNRESIGRAIDEFNSEYKKIINTMKLVCKMTESYNKYKDLRDERDSINKCIQDIEACSESKDVVDFYIGKYNALMNKKNHSCNHNRFLKEINKSFNDSYENNEITSCGEDDSLEQKESVSIRLFDKNKVISPYNFMDKIWSQIKYKKEEINPKPILKKSNQDRQRNNNKVHF